jgi:hypothetical protein
LKIELDLLAHQQNQKKGLAAWLIKKGIVKTEQQSELLLLGVFVLCLLLSVLVSMNGSDATIYSNVNEMIELYPEMGDMSNER